MQLLHHGKAMHVGLGSNPIIMAKKHTFVAFIGRTLGYLILLSVWGTRVVGCKAEDSSRNVLDRSGSWVNIRY